MPHTHNYLYKREACYVTSQYSHTLFGSIHFLIVTCMFKHNSWLEIPCHTHWPPGAILPLWASSQHHLIVNYQAMINGFE